MISRRSFIIFLHGVFELLAYIVGFRYYLYLGLQSEDKLTEQQRLIILIAGIIGALALLQLFKAYKITPRFSAF